MRALGRPLSKHTAMPQGLKRSSSFMNMDMKPNTALVGVPSGAVMLAEIAWNALWIRELPSTTATVLRWSAIEPPG